MVFKNIEELDRQGVQILSPREIERLRKRFRDVHTKFIQYQKPAGDSKWNRLIAQFVCVERFEKSAPETFENAACFLRLGLPSTLIRQENGAFGQRPSIRGIWKCRLCVFRVEPPFLNSSGLVWTENICCVFRVKFLVSNSSFVVWTGLIVLSECVFCSYLLPHHSSHGWCKRCWHTV